MTYQDDQARFFEDWAHDEKHRKNQRNRALLAAKLKVSTDELMTRLRGPRITRALRGDLVAINHRPANLDDDELVAWCVGKLNLD